MVVINDPQMIDEALFTYNEQLASEIIKHLGDFTPKRIVEIGSGDGTFTIPFIQKMSNSLAEFHCVDTFEGPYSGNNVILERRLKESMLWNSVTIQKMDAASMNLQLHDIDLIIGHEVLCDLNEEKVNQVLSSAYHTLENNGYFIHSDLSPAFTSRSEELVILADSYSIHSLSTTEWFSPHADDLARICYDIGFRSIAFHFTKIRLIFRESAALSLLDSWGTEKSFFHKYESDLKNYGLEFPMEQILICRKLCE